MLLKRFLQLVHYTGTIWFVMCVVYILVLAMRQANASWWLILSLSGHSILIVLLLTSLYLFAIFQDVTSNREATEHPLTSTYIYSVFYNLSPFFGGLAGFLGALGESSVKHYALIVAYGTFAVTFFVWVIVDPLMGMLELLWPENRKHRIERLAAVKILRQQQDKVNDRLLADLLQKEEIEHLRRNEMLLPKVEKLVDLMVSKKIDNKTEHEAVEIGVSAWVMGGQSCMKQLYDLVVEVCQQKNLEIPIAEYISVWWDGIGDWRSKSII